jgi:DNA-binding NtrC family response regulator
VDLLARYSWPGNVRELENAVERACALCEQGVIKPHDLPPHVIRHVPGANGSALPVGQTLEEFVVAQERRYIEETIKHHGGNREKAAKTLRISMATLYRKLGVKKSGKGK